MNQSQTIQPHLPKTASHHHTEDGSERLGLELFHISLLGYSDCQRQKSYQIHLVPFVSNAVVAVLKIWLWKPHPSIVVQVLEVIHDYPTLEQPPYEAPRAQFYSVRRTQTALLLQVVFGTFLPGATSPASLAAGLPGVA